MTQKAHVIRVRDHVSFMSDKPTTDLLGALPRTRPHRRSGKRAERADSGPEATPQNTEATTQANGSGRKPARTQSAAKKTPAPRSTAAKKPARATKAKAPATAKAAGKAPATAKASAKASSAKTTATGAAKKPATSPPRPRAVPGTGPGSSARLRDKAAGSRLRQPPQPLGTPSGRRSRKPVPASGTEIFGTAVQAAAELAEIGLSVSARALRNAVSKLPKP
jgi:hypothetical protein